MKESLIDKLKQQGVQEHIIDAFAQVDRTKFMAQAAYAYQDNAFPIGHGQTISQPSTIAFMLQLLDIQPQHKVLEIGSGSGYVLALLSHLAKHVYGVERIKELVQTAKQRIDVPIIHDDGSKGVPQYAPYDRILVSAAYKESPIHLTAQLKESSIIVSSVDESIVKITKKDGQITQEEYHGFRFVPIVSGDVQSTDDQD